MLKIDIIRVLDFNLTLDTSFNTDIIISSYKNINFPKPFRIQGTKPAKPNLPKHYFCNKISIVKLATSYNLNCSVRFSIKIAILKTFFFFLKFHKS